MILMVPVMSPMTSKVMASEVMATEVMATEVVATEVVPSQGMAEIERRVNGVGVQGIGIRADRVAPIAAMGMVSVTVSARMNLLD